MKIDEKEIKVRLLDVDYKWSANDLAKVKLEFIVITTNPKFDPFEVGDFLSIQFEEFLKSKNNSPN